MRFETISEKLVRDDHERLHTQTGQAHPVLQRTEVVADVQVARGPVSREDPEPRGVHAELPLDLRAPLRRASERGLRIKGVLGGKRHELNLPVWCPTVCEAQA